MSLKAPHAISLYIANASRIKRYGGQNEEKTKKNIIRFNVSENVAL